MRLIASPFLASSSPLHRLASHRLVPLLLSSLALTACDKPARPHPNGPGVTQAARAATLEQVPKAAVDPNASTFTPEQRATVVAKIGDQVITLGELEARLAHESPVIRSQFASAQKRKEYLATLVQFELLAAEARRRGLEKDPEVLEAAKQTMVRKFLTDMAVDEVKADSFTDADLQAYYDANPGLYHKPEQVDVSHILVKDEATARRIADELRAAAIGQPAKLVEAWNDYVGRESLDAQTVPYLGSLGLVSKTPPPGATPQDLERLARVPAEVVDAAMGREVLTVGTPIHSPMGWHVLMVTSRMPAVERAFADVKESIRPRVVKRERDLRRQKLLESLRTSVPVEMNEEALRLLQTAPPTPTKGQPAGVTTNRQPADPTPAEL